MAVVTSPDSLESKLRILGTLTGTGSAPDTKMARDGFHDGITGKPPSRNLASYMAGWNLALEVYEAMKLLVLIEMDSECPEPI